MTKSVSTSTSAPIAADSVSASLTAMSSTAQPNSLARIFAVSASSVELMFTPVMPIDEEAHEHVGRLQAHLPCELLQGDLLLHLHDLLVRRHLLRGDHRRPAAGHGLPGTRSEAGALAAAAAHLTARRAEARAGTHRRRGGARIVGGAPRGRRRRAGGGHRDARTALPHVDAGLRRLGRALHRRRDIGRGGGVGEAATGGGGGGERRRRAEAR